MTEEDIRAVLERFREGYRNRDENAIDGFMELFDDSAELEVIGTNAVKKGQGEWSYGPEGARKLVLADWKGWGNLELDLEDAGVSTFGDAAWVGMYGILKFNLEPEKNCQEVIEIIKKLALEEGDSMERLMDMVRVGSNTLYHAHKGAEFTLPIRITAVLVKRQGAWKFVQMHFSFCTNDFPDVRY